MAGSLSEFKGGKLPFGLPSDVSGSRRIGKYNCRC